MSQPKKISELSAAPYNPRRIKDKALEGLKYSIQEFGDISGITFNTRTGNLISGHQRVKSILSKFGDIQITDEQIKTPAGNFSVRFVDWPEEKERAANIAANAQTIQGEWTADINPLLMEIELIAPQVFDTLGFSELSLQEPEILIEVAKQTSEVKQEHRNTLKFGDLTLYISDNELEVLTQKYNDYVQKNRTTFGFVTYLTGEVK